MEVFQLVIDALLVLGVIVAAGAFVMSFRNTQVVGEHENKGIRRAALVGLVFLVIALIGSLSMVIVPAGSVGVVTAFGAVQDEALQPGLHFRLPFINTVHEMTTRVQPHPFADIEAASAEYQSVRLTGIMNYHIDGEFAAGLYQRVGDDFAGKILDPAFNDYIKTVVPTYSITEILPKRDEIRSKAKADLQANLDHYHIVIDDIYLANVAFSPEYTAAIEAKQVAQQQVSTEQQILAQKRIQAEQAVVQAQGNANANVETAKGQAEANRLLTQSLTPELIQYTLIQKLAPTIQTILMPAGQQFILDPKALVPTK